AEKGAEIFDADGAAKRILRQSEEIQQRLAQEFGNSILDAHGGIIFGRLADAAFASTQKQERLNALIHPILVNEILKCMRRAEDRGTLLFVLDAALLFEAGWDQYMDISMTITADEEIRVTRALARRPDLTEADIRRRMQLQLPEHEKAARADHTLLNNGTMNEFRQAAEELYILLLSGELG
ncbi:dephospho-CoA kinase, partial [Candidatus Neomarinimicrobiota bacterium]